MLYSESNSFIPWLWLGINLQFSDTLYMACQMLGEDIHFVSQDAMPGFMAILAKAYIRVRCVWIQTSSLLRRGWRCSLILHCICSVHSVVLHNFNGTCSVEPFRNRTSSNYETLIYTAIKAKWCQLGMFVFCVEGVGCTTAPKSKRNWSKLRTFHLDSSKALCTNGTSSTRATNSSWLPWGRVLEILVSSDMLVGPALSPCRRGHLHMGHWPGEMMMSTTAPLCLSWTCWSQFMNLYTKFSDWWYIAELSTDVWRSPSLVRTESHSQFILLLTSDAIFSLQHIMHGARAFPALIIRCTASVIYSSVTLEYITEERKLYTCTPLDDVVCAMSFPMDPSLEYARHSSAIFAA